MTNAQDEEWVYVGANIVESTDILLAEIRKGEPLRRVEVEWCGGNTLLVRDEHDQFWSITYPTSSSVWLRRRTN
jgi:hypothetical protein